MQKRRLGFEIRTLSNLIKRYIDANKPPELDCHTGVHGWAIKFFYDNRGKEVFQRDFEEHFSIRRSTATNMLKLMEKNGLIVRESVERDARLKRVVLTDKAIEIHKKITNSINESEAAFSRGITQEELKAFYLVLDKVKSNLEAKND